MKATFLALGLLLIPCTYLNADVITDSNIILSVDGGWSDYALTVYQDEAGTDPTTIWFDITGSTLSVVTYNLDEASDWFLTSLNQEFSETSISNNSHPALIQHVPSYQRNDLDVGLFGTFYLGVNTGQGFSANNFSDREVYGWALLRNTSGSLELLDNAMAYGGTGIYIGTTTQIPEPSTIALVGGGSLAIYLFRQRKTKKGRNRVKRSD